MKILVRNRCDKHFTYMDLSYGPNGFCDKSGMRIPETNIVDVVRDTRKNYVRCGYCGKLIKNNPEAIAAHWEEQEKKIDCLKCDWLAPADVANGSLKIKYVHDKENPDLYVCTNKFKVTLNCSYFGNIESDEAKEIVSTDSVEHEELNKFPISLSNILMHLMNL